MSFFIIGRMKLKLVLLDDVMGLILSISIAMICVTCCRRHCPLASYAMTSSRCSFPPVSRRSARKHDPRTPSRSRSALHVRCRHAAGRRIRRCWCARPLSLKAEVSLGILRIAYTRKPPSTRKHHAREVFRKKKKKRKILQLELAICKSWPL